MRGQNDHLQDDYAIIDQTPTPKVINSNHWADPPAHPPKNDYVILKRSLTERDTCVTRAYLSPLAVQLEARSAK